MQQVHYKITNTTKQVGARKGPHKLGFFVDVVKGKPIRPNETITVEKVTPGILAMQRKGYIKVEEVKDINVEVKKQIVEVNKEQEAKAAEAKAEVDAKTTEAVKAAEAKAETEKAKANASNKAQVSTSLDKQKVKAEVKKSRANIKAATVDADGVDPLGDLEGAEYLDGEPNFVVQAGKKNKKR